MLYEKNFNWLQMLLTSYCERMPSVTKASPLVLTVEEKLASTIGTECSVHDAGKQRWNPVEKSKAQCCKRKSKDLVDEKRIHLNDIEALVKGNLDSSEDLNQALVIWKWKGN